MILLHVGFLALTHHGSHRAEPNIQELSTVPTIKPLLYYYPKAFIAILRAHKTKQFGPRVRHNEARLWTTDQNHADNRTNLPSHVLWFTVDNCYRMEKVHGITSKYWTKKNVYFGSETTENLITPYHVQFHHTESRPFSKCCTSFSVRRHIHFGKIEVPYSVKRCQRRPPQPAGTSTTPTAKRSNNKAHVFSNERRHENTDTHKKKEDRTRSRKIRNLRAKHTHTRPLRSHGGWLRLERSPGLNTPSMHAQPQ